MMKNELGHTILAEHIVEIEESGVIKPPTSEWSSLIGLVKKTVL